MGARLYNPITNQFTSPDPITGGNETTYTYPNDPINKNDFTGFFQINFWGMKAIEFALDAAAWIGGRLATAVNPLLGSVLSVVFGLLSNSISQAIDLTWGPKSRQTGSKFSFVELVLSGVSGALAGYIPVPVLTKLKNKIKRKFLGQTVEFLVEQGFSFVIKSVLEVFVMEPPEKNNETPGGPRKTFLEARH
jgi:hypothetical protein